MKVSTTKLCHLSVSSRRKTQFTFSFLFVLKSQQKVDIKLSKMCQAIKNFASSRFTEIVYKSSSEDMSASFQAICRPLGFSKTRDNRATEYL